MEQEKKSGDVGFDESKKDLGREGLNQKKEGKEDLENQPDREHLAEAGKKPEDSKGANLNASNPSSKEQKESFATGQAQTAPNRDRAKEQQNQK